MYSKVQTLVQTLVQTFAASQGQFPNFHSLFFDPAKVNDLSYYESPQNSHFLQVLKAITVTIRLEE
ncbi:hypothetical protein B1F79_00965 [Coxiella-like endosymbiont of Rhipicephalus sanguineus]|uniref:hypothetical protein n=1 Tax=Coxiella-like endosymbiont of Rhipicephalus sanguineus TaxID=1955402 RepID=UPI0020426716|nr:hypothetical protein [Coxiella-like endosymbiont of Rhipicephalus sanguineus]MBT8506306.1 hypothetical protein [Coxiella-like endosymbiont of Rhipicephalus sanguineus]